MPVRPCRFIPPTSIAVQALLVFALLLTACDALGQQGGAALNNNRGLDFGSFIAGSGGTVTVRPDGGRSSSPGVFLLSSAPGRRAELNVSRTNVNNNNKTTVIVTLPPNGTVFLNSGVNSMAVNNFASSPASGADMPNGGILGIGASLTVAPNQVPGVYSGTFNVTVIYQ